MQTLPLGYQWNQIPEERVTIFNNVLFSTCGKLAAEETSRHVHPLQF